MGTFPVVTATKIYEGGLVQVMVDAPATWISNSMSFGLASNPVRFWGK
jgi:hypothetical protein